jgi:thiamine-monophosphate kinase
VRAKKSYKKSFKKRRSRFTDTNHDLREIGEFGLIKKIGNWMGKPHPEVIRGIGDDVAVIEMGKKALLITTDILIEDIHFERSWTDPYRLGKKALAVNLSDIAAMGGTPKYFLISLGFPKTLPFSFVSLFYRGLKEMASRHQVDLVGGDTSLSHKITINICLVGEGKKENLLFRNGAKAGDDLYVSGTLGDAALGLKILQNKNNPKKPKGLIEKHLSPAPRVALGQALGRKKIATAMIDVSDGLLSDTLHILEESKVGARIYEALIPLSTLFRRWVSDYSKDPHRIALSGGEDYELLFTASPKWQASIQSLSSSLNVPITRVGEILPKKEGVQLIGKEGKEAVLNRLGFDHFK